MGPLPLPALPSNTKGPASFLGVVGPSAPSDSKGLVAAALSVDDVSAVGASPDGGCEVAASDLLDDKDLRASMSRLAALETSPGLGVVVREPIRRVRRFVVGAGDGEGGGAGDGVGAATCSEEIGGPTERFLVVIIASISS